MVDNKKLVEKIQIIEKIIYKVRYFLEFFFSFVAVFEIYKLITTLHYSGHINKVYLICAIIYTILAITCLAYCCYKDRKKIEKIFVTFAIPIGMLYLIFMLPANVPDEFAHIWKAYEVSTGKFITTIEEDGSSHTDVPKDLTEYTSIYITKYKDLIDKLSLKTDYNDMEQVFSPAQSYCFVLYLPSSLGFVISRLFQLNILVGVYLGRIFNFIVFLILGYYTIKIIPFGKLLMATYLFIPMMFHQAISFSADSITNSTCILFIAYVLSLLFQNDKITKTQNILLLILSIIVGVVKIAYVPLLGLSILLLFKKNENKKEKAIIILSIIIGGISAISMYILSNQYISLIESIGANDVINPSEQTQYIIENPTKFLKVLIRDLNNKGKIYLDMMLGQYLGALNIVINEKIIISFYIVILFSIIAEKNTKALDNKQRIWVLLLSIIVVVLIEFALYISWTQLEATEVQGIQGRYFIPVAILALLTLCMRNNYLNFKNINIKLMTIVSILNIFVIPTLYSFFK